MIFLPFPSLKNALAVGGRQKELEGKYSDGLGMVVFGMVLQRCVVNNQGLIVLSRAEALLVCACGRERQHPSCPCSPGFTGAVGGAGGLRGAQSSLFSVPAISPGHHVLSLGWFMAVQSHPVFCALWKWTGRVWSSFTFFFSAHLPAQPFPAPHSKRLWMKSSPLLQAPVCAWHS